MKRWIVYDRKSMMGSKNQFLKTDESIMTENRFLIGITKETRNQQPPNTTPDSD